MSLASLSRPRPFDQTFRWIVGALVFWCFAALVSTAEMPWWFNAGGAVLLAAGWYGEKKFPLSKKAWSGFIAGFLVFDIWIWQKTKTEALVFMVVFLLANKLWTPKKTRDYLQIALLSFFLILAYSVMTVGLSFVLFFLVFLLLFVTMLALLGIHREQSELLAAGARESGGVDLRQLLPAGFVKRMGGIAASILLAAISIFLLFPRFSTHNGIPILEGLGFGRSGFGGNTRLNELASIRGDTSDVLRIQFAGRDGGPLPERPWPGIYLRGATREQYEGMRWIEDERVHTRQPVMGSEAALDQPTFPDQSEVKQLVYLNPARSPSLFALEGLKKISFPKGRALSMALDHFASTVRVADERAEVLTYQATSLVRDPAAGDPDRASRSALPPGFRSRFLRPDVMAAYLEKPASPQAGKIAALAQQIAQDAHAQTRYEAARAIEAYFKRNFVYSLTNLDFGGAYPTEAFLFDQKRGHCEYFASGMAFLLRYLDIPCRIVHGYYTDRWNEIGSYFLVLQADAHSWIEVYFERGGWIAFDPTPEVAIVREKTPRFWILAKMIKWFDNVQVRWHIHVIDYDYSAWAQVVDTLGLTGPEGRGALFRALHWFRLTMRGGGQAQLGSAVAVGLGAAIGVFLLLTAGPMLLRRGPARSRRAAVAARAAARRVQAYERILRALGRRGMPKAPPATPREHARRVEAAWPELAGFSALTERYYAARFAGAPLDRREESEFSAFLRRAKAVKRRR